MTTNKKSVAYFFVTFLFMFSSLWSQSLVSITSIKKVNEDRKEAWKEVPPTRIKDISAIYSVLLGGELRNITGTEDSGEKTFANASFGISRASQRFILSLLVKVADTHPPINGNYGRALLNPAGLEQAAGYIDIAYNFSPVKHETYLRTYLTTATNKWEILRPGSGETVATQATILSWGIGVYRPIWDFEVKDAEAKIISNIFVGLTTRLLSGDLGFTTNVDLREAALGRVTRTYLGGELYWDIYFNGIKGFVDLTNFRQQIPGFGKFQVTVGIALQLKMFTYMSIGKKL